MKKNMGHTEATKGASLFVCCRFFFFSKLREFQTKIGVFMGNIC